MQLTRSPAVDTVSTTHYIATRV